jgi:hypothetical protein
MRKSYDNKNAEIPLSERILANINENENRGEKARLASYVITPDSDIWSKIGNRTFYRLYGLHNYPAGNDIGKTLNKVQDDAHSAIFIKDGTYNQATTFNFTKSYLRVEGESFGAQIQPTANIHMFQIGDGTGNAETNQVLKTLYFTDPNNVLNQKAAVYLNVSTGGGQTLYYLVLRDLFFNNMYQGISGPAVGGGAYNAGTLSSYFENLWALAGVNSLGTQYQFNQINQSFINNINLTNVSGVNNSRIYSTSGPPAEITFANCVHLRVNGIHVIESEFNNPVHNIVTLESGGFQGYLNIDNVDIYGSTGPHTTGSIFQFDGNANGETFISNAYVSGMKYSVSTTTGSGQASASGGPNTPNAFFNCQFVTPRTSALNITNNINNFNLGFYQCWFEGYNPFTANLGSNSLRMTFFYNCKWTAFSGEYLVHGGFDFGTPTLPTGSGNLNFIQNTYGPPANIYLPGGTFLQSGSIAPLGSGGAETFTISLSPSAPSSNYMINLIYNDGSGGVYTYYPDITAQSSSGFTMVLDPSAAAFTGFETIEWYAFFPSTSSYGVHIIDAFQNDMALPSDPAVIRLDPASKIYFANSVPASWLWEWL